MVGAYLIVGVVWAWLLFEATARSESIEEMREFGFWPNFFASASIVLTWPLSMVRVLRYLFKS